MKNVCPICKAEKPIFKFGKLYQCSSCQNHFYGEAPTAEDRTQTVEEIVFEERIKERKDRISAIDAEILRLAQEAREESQEEVLPESDQVAEDAPFVPIRSNGRPRKVK